MLGISTFALLLGLSATVYRIVTKYQTPGPFTHENQGLCDFHNGIYFPAKALLRGESPYSEAYSETYPVARQIPFFSPVILLMHAPLAMLPLHIAEAINTVMQILLLMGIAFFATQCSIFGKRLDIVMAVAAALIFTRGGHITIFNGYFTFQLVLSTFLAVHWAKKRPVLSGWMLLVVSAKPTYILPLGFLMLARGDWKALAVGAFLSITGAAVLLGWIAYNGGDGDFAAGVTSVIADIVETQNVHRNMEDESPVYSWTRLDLFAIIAKWRGIAPGDLAHLLSMFAFLTLPMVVLWKRAALKIDDGITGVTGALLMTALLVSLYHQSYDSLLTVAPTVGAIALVWDSQRLRGNVLRLCSIALMTFPAINYLSTRSFLNRFELSDTLVKVFTSLSGLSLALALVLATWVAWKETKTHQQQ